MLTPEEYAAKREARYNRLLAAAARADQEADQQRAASDRIADFIPFGQPVLIGHHSEKRHRADLEKIQNKARKGYELAKKAEEYRQRAAAIEENRAIFSDDPEAAEKIGGKIAQLEARQERMKEANKLIRKQDRAGLESMGYTPAQVESLLSSDYCGLTGYPHFMLTNNGAEIRRLKKRAAEVEKKQATPDKDEEINGIKIQWRPSENRIRIYYPARVDLDTFKALKRNGFRVLRSEGEGVFSAYYNRSAAYFVQELRKESNQ